MYRIGIEARVDAGCGCWLFESRTAARQHESRCRCLSALQVHVSAACPVWRTAKSECLHVLCDVQLLDPSKARDQARQALDSACLAKLAASRGQTDYESRDERSAGRIMRGIKIGKSRSLTGTEAPDLERVETVQAPAHRAVCSQRNNYPERSLLS